MTCFVLFQPVVAEGQNITAIQTGSGAFTMIEIRTKRLTASDREDARSLFTLMAQVFSEDSASLSDCYLDRLLSRDDFWAIAAFADGGIVGGVTAHTLPMTRTESSEIFVYDIAVRSDYQRKGVGRQLMKALCEQALEFDIRDVFVAADNDDVHALDFYRCLGGQPSPATIFTFSSEFSDAPQSHTGSQQDQ
jgi:aminoglycoside 3-N-acetyltransferase I